LEKWRSEAVDYNDYAQYGILFDPTVPWAEKKNLYPSAPLASYRKEKKYLEREKERRTSVRSRGAERKDGE
jgi:hypothetical protein